MFHFCTIRFVSDSYSYFKNSFDVDVYEVAEKIPRHELIKRIAGKNGLLCMGTDRIDEEVLDAAGIN